MATDAVPRPGAGRSLARSCWRTRTTRDLAVALALAALAFVPALGLLGGQLGDLPPRPWTAGTVPLLLAQTVPLALRTRYPALCLAVVGVAFAVYQSLAYLPTLGSVGLYLALYSVGAHQVRFRRVLPVLAGAGYAAFAVGLHLLGSPDRLLDYLLIALMLAACWLLGCGVRVYRVGAAERRRLVAEAAAAAERSRIARELHDVVTHHVTAMVVQADAAQLSPGSGTEALASIGGTGRRALADLRQLLGVLEATGDAGPGRQPALDDLPELAASTRSAGQPVDLTERGRRPALTPVAQLTCYRVVQEALTNAVKYAPGRPTVVRLRHDRGGTDVEVTTEGPAAVPEPAGLTGGRGLSGLRDRVTALGGELEARPEAGGGFRVRARIPAGARA
jgi:signal transduction histidine kinase